jgi:dephospho-CoA kinase
MSNYPAIYLIGLTGGIACGKSSVLEILTSLGARTIDADQVTHQLQQPGTRVYQQIVATFGREITGADGAIDRRKLGAVVFQDPARLRQLEQIVHPAVRADMHATLAEANQAAHDAGGSERPVVVIDAIKLIESGWAAACDQVWVVTCSTEQQIERMVTTRKLSEGEARARIAAQADPASRLPYAHLVIDNSGSRAQTRAQVETAWQQLALLRRVPQA